MKYAIVFTFAIFFFISLLSIAANASASAPVRLAPTPTPIGRVATLAELEKASREWSKSAHTDTYDNGMGANTTCARCKSPRNWQADAVAAQQALDCAACKREPGAPRPELESGVPVAQTAWKNIGCEVCHQPVGNSYLTTVAFWNQAAEQYEAVKDATELCAKCHEGKHGFQVIEEQEASSAHKGWECTRCHGAHGSPSKCTDCHEPAIGFGAEEHARHPETNCTACHDAGGLVIWHDQDDGSRHYDEYVQVRFAHALTSWPSHNIQLAVDCKRCHHPQGIWQAVVASKIGCDKCHPEGAGLLWCTNFARNPDPIQRPTPEKK